MKYLFLFISFFIFIDTAQATAYWTEKFKITGMYATNPGSFPIRVWGLPQVTGLGCSSSDGRFAYLDATDPNYEIKTAMLMMAFRTKKDVILVLDDSNTTGCHIVEIGVFN